MALSHNASDMASTGSDRLASHEANHTLLGRRTDRPPDLNTILRPVSQEITVGHGADRGDFGDRQHRSGNPVVSSIERPSTQSAVLDRAIGGERALGTTLLLDQKSM